jgi:hypothetical protein
MKRLTYCLLVTTLLLGAPILTGCATTPTTTASAQADDIPYAGGNGEFGEDPVNPGQYASSHASADHN